MVEIRILGDGDQAALEAFLLPRVETSMFLLGNSRRAGLVDRGEDFQGAYAAAFDGKNIVGVVAHLWNGALLTQSPPEHLDALWRAAVKASARLIHGFVGPYDQATAIAKTLNVTSCDLKVDSKETLFRLSLERLIEPEALQAGKVTARLAAPVDEALLADWRADYAVETLGETDTPLLRVEMRNQVRHYTETGQMWVLEADGGPMAMTSFNAAIAEAVQVGGVYTPPELRRRGYARAVVAASLKAARKQGAPTAILFTEEDNIPAQKAYISLGFNAIGDYALLLLRKPISR